MTINICMTIEWSFSKAPHRHPERKSFFPKLYGHCWPLFKADGPPKGRIFNFQPWLWYSHATEQNTSIWSTRQVSVPHVLYSSTVALLWKRRRKLKLVAPRSGSSVFSVYLGRSRSRFCCTIVINSVGQYPTVSREEPEPLGAAPNELSIRSFVSDGGNLGSDRTFLQKKMINTSSDVRRSMSSGKELYS